APYALLPVGGGVLPALCEENRYRNPGSADAAVQRGILLRLDDLLADILVVGYSARTAIKLCVPGGWIIHPLNIQGRCAVEVVYVLVRNAYVWQLFQYAKPPHESIRPVCSRPGK